MKLQYKTATIMTLLATLIVILLSVGYDILNRKIVIVEGLKNSKNIAEEAALHMDSYLREKAMIAKTLSSAPIIKNALLASNVRFESLTAQEQEQEISNLNQQWKNTSDINDPFIQSHMNNPIAEHLKHQQRIAPGEYGEIFLTNRFGVMIASTGKLTTLAHAHKYWWQAAFQDGQGRVFLDDRGFDNSVNGYVLGVVIPIRDENEIIGILKCNINIIGSLTKLVKNFAKRQPGNMKFVRTGGLIVSEQGADPLSTQVSGEVVNSLQHKKSGTIIVEENNEKKLLAFAPMQITMGSKEFGFGGSKESIDHIKGNQGEGWSVLVSTDEKEITANSQNSTTVIVAIGLIFTFFTAIAALLIGKWISKPIIELANTAQTIGEGHLDAQVAVNSNDEIGSLAKSLNRMAKNLQDKMTSIDELAIEVQQRKKTELEKEAIIVKLEQASAEIKTLKGIFPICMYCKEIRDDKGYWNQLEKYISEHSEAQFSHGICDKCYEKHFPEETD